MPTHVEFRHGLETNRTSIVPRVGEPIFTHDEKILYIGDGLTPGGVRAKTDAVTIAGFDIAAGSPNDGDTLVYNANTGEWEFAAGGSGSGGGCTTLGCLSDVNPTSATDGQILSYNASSETWIPVSVSGGSPHDLESHTDVNLSGLANGDMLQWNGSAWVAVTAPSGTGGGVSYARQFLFASF